MSASALEGRVFDRWRHAQTLPAELQTDVEAVRAFLAAEDGGRKDTFTTKAAALGAKGRPVTTAVGKTLLAAVHKKLEELKGKEDTAVTPEYARKVADALVLVGFVTPSKDPGNALEGFAFDSDVFVGVGADIAADPDAKTIWNVREGAIQAGKLRRKRAGFFAKLTGAKPQSYVVANEATKTLYVFDSDTSRSPPIVALELAGASVEFTAAVEHGVKVAPSGGAAEIFGADSKEKAEEWLNSIINAGATYREAFNANLEGVKSIYELKDYDMSGNEVSMEKYKGKVLLIVNVSSKCGLTPTNYPEMTLLDERYREQGLQVLAFPCNQFSNQEPGTHEEIMEFVKQYNCQFPFFEKHDVNGASARPVFTYLKAKLPGTFGSFVKWNFTKFLVDRNGQPYKRYAPKDLPLSFEDDIKTLLEQPASADADTNRADAGGAGEAAAAAVPAATTEESVAPTAAEEEEKGPAAEAVADKKDDE